MTRRSVPCTDLELRSSSHTPEGRLEVVARRIDDRWWIVARCGRWRGFGMHSRLGPAIDAALRPYAEGVSLTAEAEHA